MSSTNSTGSRLARGSRPSTTLFSACLLLRNGSVPLHDAPNRPNSARRSVRRLSAVSLPSVCNEESAALELRGIVSAGLVGDANRLRSILLSDGVRDSLLRRSRVNCVGSLPADCQKGGDRWHMAGSNRAQGHP